ncbi:MAG: [FeFe] hydrogenase H-cluster radical SAM maturase HydE [Prevotellaceae bacterium]|jgi:biotin synthase|nr:[FeFe] hydrogenase H-cluster radical SAM maturase HydE [Prevotellaceae bacterium]
MTRSELIELLSIDDPKALQRLFARTQVVQSSVVGTKVFLRGLIEYSNRCRKNCYYCGIRGGNRRVGRYELTDGEVLQAVDFAWRNRYGSIVLQSGERQSARFVSRIARLLRQIKEHTHGEVGITLSCGEQPDEVYRQWFEAGAHRYLLRIETASPALYARLHPATPAHDFDARITALHQLKAIGYRTGTGVMIGLPFQTPGDLADDLLFFRRMDVAMVGMGPYLEHRDTPLYRYKDRLLPPAQRLTLALKMVAALRLLMPHINIAATTALQALHPTGREQALQAGANVFMPNLTPVEYRASYRLYDSKPCLHESPGLCMDCTACRIRLAGNEIGYGEWGDR